MTNVKRDLKAKVEKSIDKYLGEIKPILSSKDRKKEWQKIKDLLLGLLKGKSCFLNTITENTKHYQKKEEEFTKGKRKKGLNKNAQIDKLSAYLCFSIISKIALVSYLKFLGRKYFSQKNPDSDKNHSIKEKIYHKKLCLHDGTDIQKPYAKRREEERKKEKKNVSANEVNADLQKDWKEEDKKRSKEHRAEENKDEKIQEQGKKTRKGMEKLCNCRDGSKSSAKKIKVNKGYLVEGSAGFYRGRFFPFLLNTWSYLEEKFKNEKEKTLENIKTLKKNRLCQQFLHIFDRGYDDVQFMLKAIKDLRIKFLIRANLKRNIVLKRTYDIFLEEKKTKKEALKLFKPMKDIINKEIYFQKHPEYDWFEIASSAVYLKGRDFSRRKDLKEDLIPVNLVAVRIINKNKEGIEGIEEDLEQGEKEREIYFFTNDPIETIDDAIVIFYCYLKRWKIETWFKLLKQIFGMEKICLDSFVKIKALISLLPLATNYYYKFFNKFEKKEQEIKKGESSKEVFEKNKYKRTQEAILGELIFCCFKSFCSQKNRTTNPHSFTEFIHDAIGFKISYPEKILDLRFDDTS